MVDDEVVATDVLHAAATRAITTGETRRVHVISFLPEAGVGEA